MFLFSTGRFINHFTTAAILTEHFKSYDNSTISHETTCLVEAMSLFGSVFGLKYAQNLPDFHKLKAEVIL